MSSAPSELLEVDALEVTFGDGARPARVLRGVSLELRRGTSLGLLGESGSGKTTLGLALLGLLPKTARVRGRVRLGALSLLELDDLAMQRVRGRQLSMIFQQPQTALNPVLTIGRQIGEAARVRDGLDRSATSARVRALLELVGLQDVEPRAYPHQLSGGMQQRVLIALALACRPDFLIADEPTTALDVVVERQILELLERLRQALELALLLVSHDLSVIARCERTVVLYGGEVVELGPTHELLTAPRHPYTRALAAAAPGLGALPRSIPGAPPDVRSDESGCRFAPRCPRAAATCRQAPPPLCTPDDAGRAVRCLFPLQGPDRSTTPPRGEVRQ